MINFLQENYIKLGIKTMEHLGIAFLALILGVIVAVPLGILLTRTKKISKFSIGLVSVLQTVPSLALLAIMIPIFGVGKLPAIIALFIYSLLPILRNTYIGISDVDKNIVDAAKGMGFTNMQILFKVELPLSAPVIMSGIRLSGVYVISWATLASYVGAGGLGDFIFTGLNNGISNMIIIGTIPVAILALLIDLILGKVEESVTPKKSSQMEDK